MRVVFTETIKYKYSTIKKSRTTGIALRDRFVFNSENKCIDNDIVIMRNTQVICVASKADIQQAKQAHKLTDAEYETVEKIVKSVSKGMVI